MIALLAAIVFAVLGPAMGVAAFFDTARRGDTD